MEQGKDQWDKKGKLAERQQEWLVLLDHIGMEAATKITELVENRKPPNAYHVMHRRRMES